jgi:replicative DNA helicase
MQSKAQELISGVTSGLDKEISIKEQADKAHERLMQMSNGLHIELSTGFINLDLMLSGLQKKKYYLIAGLPSVGKSCFAHNILYHIAVELQQPAALFCYESDAASVILRMVSMKTGIDLFENAHKTKDNERVVEVFSKIQKSPMMIFDDMPFNVEYAVAKAQRLKVEYPDLSLIVFDHLHEMTADVGKYGNQEAVVSTISGNLKRLAKLIDVPVVALCQMSRASIKQQNPRPMLNDLRASGALEFGADVVVFVYRDDYYESTTPSPISETEIIIRKNRDGPVGTLKYQYYRAINKFEEWG